ncbi:MAG: tetratricopeptide repeat protein, partial [Methanothrix sp.]|nr:tetratricopeptide repeat protein [Methanothrix sp.]
MTAKKAALIKKTIDAYSLALQNEQDPIEKARIQEKIADNYYELALIKIDDRRYAMRKAAEAYQETLKIRILKDFPSDYARIQNNLGAAYQTLANVEDKAENCKKAIGAYQDALKISTLNDFPIIYAMTQDNLGIAYRTLAEVEDKAENCKKAIEAYQDALKIRTL